jgi:hypothetical protein
MKYAGIVDILSVSMVGIFQLKNLNLETIVIVKQWLVGIVQLARSY